MRNVPERDSNDFILVKKGWRIFDNQKIFHAAVNYCICTEATYLEKSEESNSLQFSQSLIRVKDYLIDCPINISLKVKVTLGCFPSEFFQAFCYISTPSSIHLNPV
jgi:hypothetical protein